MRLSDSRRGEDTAPYPVQPPQPSTLNVRQDDLERSLLAAVLSEKLFHLRAISEFGHSERCQARLVTNGQVRSLLQQQDGNLFASSARAVMQRRVTARVQGVDVGIATQQFLHRLELRIMSCRVKQCGAAGSHRFINDGRISIQNFPERL